MASMAEMTEQLLQQQMELLRDMRDELRASRSQAGMTGGVSSAGGRTFTHAQSAIDRTLSGEWNSLGWSNAYSSTYKSSFLGDISAVAGFTRAPETMAQQEFQALAGQSIFARTGSAALGLIAPGFNSRSNALADEIYAHSGRFVRFGSGNAGVMGAGLDFGVARTLSRQIGIEALSDLRLSQRDYGAITSLGIQSGQFDQASDTGDFKRKVRELASATGDLTRALHMTVQEVGTAMGNMRQLGVTNVGQQRQMLMQAGSAALVAGMSAPEMLQVAGGIAGQGLMLGLGAQSTFGLGANNMAMVRGLAAGGLLQNGLLAMGGGAQAVAGNISQTQMNYAASNAGMLTYMGGGAGGGDSILAMLRGLGKIGGSFEDLVGADYNRVKNLSGMTGDDISAMFTNRIKTQLGLMGVSDLTSKTAQGMAFRMARSMGMEDAAAHVFTQANFSEEGLRNTDATRVNGYRAKNFREQAVAYDKYLMRNSFAGAVRGGIQEIESFFGGVVEEGSSWFSKRQGKTWLGRGGIADDFEAAIATGTTGGLGIDAIADAMAATDLPVAPSRMRVYGAPDMTKGIDVMGIGKSDYAVTRIPSLYTDFEDSASIKAMTDVSAAVQGADRNVGRSLILKGMAKGKAWEKITEQNLRGRMTATAFRDQSMLIVQAAQESQLSVQAVVNMAAAIGIDNKLPDMVSFGDTKYLISQTQSDAMSALLGDTKKLSNLASPNNSRALAEYLTAESAGTGPVDTAIQMNAITALGSRDEFNALREKVRKEIATTEGKGRVAEVATGFSNMAKQVANAELNRTNRAATQYLTDLVNSGRGGKETDAIKAQLGAIEGGQQTFLAAMNDGPLATAAKRGDFGHLFKSVASIDSNEELLKTSSFDIATKYHLVGMEKQLDQIKSKNPSMLRAAIQSQMLGDSNVQAEQNSPARAAEMMSKAASIIDRVYTTMTSGTTKPPGG
jgi:hypothetical protein